MRVLLLCLTAACGTQAATPDAGSAPTEWSGVVDVSKSLTIAGALDVRPGAEVRFGSGVELTIEGSMTVDGSSQPVRFLAADQQWRGITVTGALTASGLQISGANKCLDAGPSSAIDIERSTFTDCGRALELSRGGTFSEVTITGGASIAIVSGRYAFTDVTIDLGSPGGSADCTKISSGQGTFDRVRFTGCGSAIHFDRGSGPIAVTNSVLDGVAVGVSLARIQATFAHNNIETLGAGPHFLDIGGGIQANVAGNFYGGGPAVIVTVDDGQFTGVGDYSTTAFLDVGPR